MRQVASIADGLAAQRFGDFLTSLKIANTVEPGGTGFAVWVHDDDQIALAGREWQAFQQDPSQPRYADAEAVAAKLRRDSERKEQTLRKNYVDVRTSWAGLVSRPMPLTIILIALSCLATFLTNFGENLEPVTNKLYIASVRETEHWVYWDDLHDIRHGQIWRVITPIFLHFSITHIVFNMWWLFDLGSMIERRKGTLWMLFLVLASGISGNLAQYYWSGPLGGGMSGVVYALFGYVWMKSIFEPREGMAVRNQTVILMIVWLFACMTGYLGPIGNAAHVVGLLAGLAIGLGPYSWKKFRNSRRKLQ